MKNLKQQSRRTLSSIKREIRISPDFSITLSFPASISLLYIRETSVDVWMFQLYSTDRRIQLTQHRKNIQTDFITHIFILQIGTVCNITLTQTTQIIQNILTAHLQQRPCNTAVMRTDTFQAIDSRATYQIQ